MRMVLSWASGFDDSMWWLTRIGEHVVRHVLKQQQCSLRGILSCPGCVTLSEWSDVSGPQIPHLLNKKPQTKKPVWTRTSRYHNWPQGTWSPWDEYCSYWHQDGGPWGAWLLSVLQFSVVNQICLKYKTFWSWSNISGVLLGERPGVPCVCDWPLFVEHP